MSASLWTLSFKVVVSGLLGYAAVEDLRRRVVPFPAGISILLIGAAALFWDQHWMVGLFYLSAVIGSKGGIWGLLPVLFGLGTLTQPRLMEEAYPASGNYIGRQYQSAHRSIPRLRTEGRTCLPAASSGFTFQSGLSI